MLAVSILLAFSALVSAQVSIASTVNCNCGTTSFSYNNMCYCDAQATLVTNCLNAANPNWMTGITSGSPLIPTTTSVPGINGNLNGVTNTANCNSFDPIQNPTGYQQCIQQYYSSLSLPCQGINAQQNPTGYQQCIQQQLSVGSGALGSIFATPGIISAAISNINSCSQFNVQQNPTGFQQCIQQYYPTLAQSCQSINAAQQNPTGYQQCVQNAMTTSGTGIATTGNINSCSQFNVQQNPTGFQQCIQQYYPTLAQTCQSINAQQNPTGYQQCVQNALTTTGTGIANTGNINSCSQFNVQQNPTGFQQCIQQYYPTLAQSCQSINAPQNPTGYQQCVQNALTTSSNNPTSPAMQQVVNCINQTGARSTTGQVGINGATTTPYGNAGDEITSSSSLAAIFAMIAATL